MKYLSLFTAILFLSCGDAPVPQKVEEIPQPKQQEQVEMAPDSKLSEPVTEEIQYEDYKGDSIDFTGKVMNILPDIDPSNCELTGAYDHNWSELVFLDETNFIELSYFVPNMDIERGKYYVKNNSLLLTYDSKVTLCELTVLSDGLEGYEDAYEIKIGQRSEEYLKITYEFKQCQDELFVYFHDDKIPEFKACGKIDSKKNVKEIIEGLNNDNGLLDTIFKLPTDTSIFNYQYKEE